MQLTSFSYQPYINKPLSLQPNPITVTLSPEEVTRSHRVSYVCSCQTSLLWPSISIGDPNIGSTGRPDDPLELSHIALLP
jgi:hypothetical protein